MNELVRLTTQDVGKAIPITDSLIVAEKIQYEHYIVTRLIKKHIEDFREFGAIDFESCLLNSKNVDVYLLNENQFYLLVTYLRATKKSPLVLELKKELVRQFSAMKSELTARSQTRHIAISVRKNLTDTIKKCVTDEGNFKNWAFSTYSRLVYKKVLGKDVKKAKLERNVKEKENIRDYLTIEELEKVQDLESEIATFIEFTDTNNMTDKEVYAMVKTHIEK